MSRCGWCRMPRVPGEIGTTWNFLCGSSTSCAVHQQQSEACKEIKRLQAEVKRLRDERDNLFSIKSKGGK